MNYADPMDRATVEEQRILELNIQSALAKKPDPMPFRGSCYNCDEKLDDGKRFCDSECRDDFEARRRGRAMKLS